MKRLKVDFSKQGIKRFWLHHAEKIVLVIAVALLGVFLWMGYSKPLLTETNPDAMSAMSVDAKRHISSPESWEKIKGFRHADSTAHIRIEESKGFTANSSDFPFGAVLGTVTATLGLRNDPVLRPVGELIAKSKTIPIYLKGEDKDWKQLPVARAAEEKTPTKDKEGRDSTAKPLKVDPNAPGLVVSQQQLDEMAGIRTKFADEGAAAVYPMVRDVVCVTGVIPYENQYAEFQNVFANSLGYYPDRDRPIYVYLDIERKIEGGEFENITKDVLDDSEKLAAAPVPEVIDPKYYYDKNITRPIIPMGGIDYRDFASHPSVPLRPLVPSSLKKAFDRTPESEAQKRDPFGENKPPVDAESPDGTGSKKGDGSAGDSTDQKTSASQDSAEIERMFGTDISDFDRFQKRIRPAAPFKLVRFFDLRAPVGKRVQYRVRIWMPDPNVLDFDAATVAKSTDGKKDAPTAGVGEGSSGLDGGGASNAPQDPGGKNEGGLEDDINIEKYTKILVQQHMLEPKVRARLDEQEKPEYVDALPKDKPKIEFMLPTPWSDPTPEVLVGDDFFDVYAGKVEEPKMLRVNNIEVPRDEPRATVVASVLSKEINAAVPGLREVGRGDVLNFIVEMAHVLRPTTMTVHEYKNAEIKTDAIVVDLMGGKNLDIKSSKMEFTTPGAILVMDANGNFKIHDESKDLKAFRHSMFRDDESNEYGRRREKTADNNNKQGGGNNPPPGG
jgi:hypothetical protein